MILLYNVALVLQLCLFVSFKAQLFPRSLNLGCSTQTDVVSITEFSFKTWRKTIELYSSYRALNIKNEKQYSHIYKKMVPDCQKKK